MRFVVMLQDARRAEITANQLAAVGFGADHFNCFSDATEALFSNAYDLVLTESRLSDGNAVEWLRGWNARKRPDSTFVIVLADREDERVAALEAGADDSAMAMVSGRELVARIRAVLRRPRERAASSVSLGNLSICTDARVVTVSGREIAIQRRETAILEVLLRRAGNVVPRGALEHDVYGLNVDCAPNSLEVRISRLRRHLSDAGASPSIETVRGVGYRLIDGNILPRGRGQASRRTKSMTYAQAAAA